MIKKYYHHTKDEHDAHLQLFDQLGISYSNTVYDPMDGIYSSSSVDRSVHELMVILEGMFIHLDLPNGEFHVFLNKGIDQLRMYLSLNNKVIPTHYETKIVELYDNVKKLPKGGVMPIEQ